MSCTVSVPALKDWLGGGGRLKEPAPTDQILLVWFPFLGVRVSLSDEADAEVLRDADLGELRK